MRIASLLAPDRATLDVAIAPSIDEWRAFLAVVEHQNFTRAAKALGVQKAAVSKRVSALEARVGVRLFTRTTRAVVVTDAARALATRAAEALSTLDRALDEARATTRRPTGRVRATAPLVFGDELIAPLVARFLEDNPGVSVELAFVDRRVDLVREGFDVAIRAGPMSDSDLRVRKLGAAESTLVASPAYLARAGTPKKPSDLRSHSLCVFSTGDGRTARLELRGPRGRVVIDRAPRLVCSSQVALRRALVDGAGIGLIPWYLARNAIERGALVELLERHRAPVGTLQLLTASPTPTSAVSAFVSMLLEAFRDDRPWVRPR